VLPNGEGSECKSSDHEQETEDLLVERPLDSVRRERGVYNENR
jgi:hypothetical protein